MTSPSPSAPESGSGPKTGRRPWIRSSVLIALLITAATVAWVGSGMLGATEDPTATEAALQPPAAAHRETKPPEVRVQDISAQTRVETLRVLGETRASRLVEVKAETGGRIAEVGADEGEAVAGGDLLVRLAMNDRMERLSQAEAAVARWEDRYAADRRLADRDFTSRQRVLESRAALEDARAAMAAILLDIDRTRIAAPFDGIVETRLAEEGDYVGVGDPVARVVDLDPLLVVGRISEVDIGRVTIGQSGSATLVTGKRLSGTVSYISPVADGVTRTFPVELRIPNPDGAVPEGMTADLHLPLSETRAHLIQASVLSLDDEGRIGVKLVDADNRVVFHPVTLAGDSREGLWVDGLPDPATLIIVGQEFVRAGQQVRPVHEDTIRANTAALSEADRAALATGRSPAATVQDVDAGEETRP